jgi:hypothetical protein
MAESHPGGAHPIGAHGPVRIRVRRAGYAQADPHPYDVGAATA